MTALRTAQANDAVFGDSIDLIDDALGDLDGTREKKILDNWAELAELGKG
ncbi:MAG: hypothetical protein IMZ57_11195 [Acidobacteria bacterium]|nr:hypothetical protein [Acidobacteriota bacterium]